MEVQSSEGPLAPCSGYSGREPVSERKNRLLRRKAPLAAAQKKKERSEIGEQKKHLRPDFSCKESGPGVL